MELPGSLADTEDENRNRKGERANLNNQNPATTDSDAVGRGGGGGGDNLEDELMGVGVEDTGDVLAQLDQEMSSMVRKTIWGWVRKYQIWRLLVQFMHVHVYVPGLMITAGHRTKSGQN